MFWSDRPGHNRRAVGRVARGLAALAILLFPGRAAAAAKDYSAQRFDVQMAVERGGDLRVTETVTFDFSAGPFTRIWRVIPSNRTDGIEILDASMDGRPWPVGDGVGHITVTGDNRVRVEWHFAPVSTSTHTFGLTYRARGVAVATTAGDIVEWKPLPAEHAYRIARTSVVITSPLATDDARIVDVRGIEGPSSIEAGDGGANADVERIRANGNLTLALRFPRGSVATTQPRWQVREERRAAAAPRWVLSAGAVFATIMVLVLALRRSEDPPPQVAPIEQVGDRVPEPMAPALSAALINNGHPTGAAAMATLLDLADRGVVAIRELPRHFGVRNFELSQVPGRHELSGHEAGVVSIAFAGAGDPVTLAKARARLARGGRQFSAAVVAELTAMGMLDEPRTVAASRLKMVGLTLLIGGAMLVIPSVMLVNVYGQWPLMIPLAIGLGGFAAIIAGATMVVLSETGLIRAARWRGYRRSLKNIAADREPEHVAFEPSRALIYAVALGLAAQWSRYLKRRPAAVPPWFASITEDPSDAAASFAWFVSSGGSSGGGAAGTGAAGGGASGAA